MTSKPPSPRSKALIALVALAMLAIFAIDCLTPLGYAIWLLYLMPLLLNAWTQRGPAVNVLAGFCTVLTVAAFFLAPSGIDPAIAIVNRGIGVLVLWLTALLLMMRHVAEAALAKNERQYRALFEHAPDAAFLADASGRFVDVSSTGLRLLGYTVDEMRQMRIQDVVIPSEAPRVDRALVEALNKRPFQREWRGRRKDGSVFIGEITSGPMPDGNLLAIVRDVTERQKAESALIETIARLTFVIEGTGTGLWDWDLATNQVRYSPEWKRLLGYEDQEVAEHLDEWRRLTHPDDIAPALESVRAFLEKPAGTLKTEFRMRHRDGGYRWILSRAAARLGEGGEALRLMGLHLDITEKKRVEAALWESGERIRLFVRHAPAAIAMFDTHMRYIAVSDRFLSDYRLNDCDVIGRSHYDAFPEMPETWKSVHARVLLGATERSDEERFERLDGSVDWVRWEMIPWRTAANEVGGAILFSEITNERRRSDQQLRALPRRLLLAQEEERRRVAHELHDQIGQVLTSVKLNLEGVARQPTLDAALRRLARAEETVDQAIDQVRSLSLGLRPSILDDLGLPAALRWHVDRQTRDTGVTGHVAVDAGEARLSPEIEIAAFRVVQEALTNVLRHAGATNVWVDVGESGIELVLRVRDDGAGFSLSAALARAAEGACVGLSGMRERVALAGGSLDITSTPGAGTQLVARLPATRAEEPR